MIRLIKTVVVEYEPNPEYYPKGSTMADMACLDAQSDSAEFGVFSGNTGEMTEKIEYEIVEDNRVVEREVVEI